MSGFIFPIALFPKDSAEIGEWDQTEYFLKVPAGLGPAIRGSVSFWDDERLWQGAPPDVERALETVRRFIGQPRFTEVIVQIEVRVSAGGDRIEYRYLALSGEWSEWADAGPLLAGPQGEQGERIFVYAQREAPNSYATLFSQRQELDEITGEYVNIGEPTVLTTIYDGWVNVGFFLMSVEDNQDGTLTFYRQWYCRIAADSNVFEPDGPIEEVSTVNLPEGPPGGYYLITASNPSADVAFFHREYYAYNPVTDLYEPSGIVEQIGGVIAPPGPEGPPGRVGDYYLITASNPPGQANTVEVYRTRYHGGNHTPLGEPELIGSAVALQGPQGLQGEQGPVGPAGESGIWTPSEEWIGEDEFLLLSWLAFNLAKYAAESIERTVRYAGTGLAMTGIGAGGVATIAGAAVLGPPGIAAGVIIGVGSAILAELADFALNNAVEPLRTVAGLTAVAEDMYCSLVPYRDFSAPSVGAWIAAYQVAEIKPLIAAGNLTAAIKGTIANHWAEVGIPAAQQEIALIIAQYHYEPAIDYTALPCTPIIGGGGQQEWDFTLSNQGWGTREPYVEGTYVAGEGWTGTPDLLGLGRRTLHVWVDMGEIRSITSVRFTLTDCYFTSGNAAEGTRVYEEFWEQVPAGANKPEGALVIWEATLGAPFSTQWLGASVVLATDGFRLARVSITWE